MKYFWEVVGVYYEPLYAYGAQVLKSPDDQGLLPDRDKRFWPYICQWTQAGAQPRA
jgi:hypothetical protein